MALTIVVRGTGAEPAPGITFDAPRIVIGRGEGCEVRLPDPSVSHRHASIRQRGTEYIVLDEGSTNGTFVGPVRLSPQAPRVLKDGDLVRVGRVWLEARIEQAPPTQNVNAATRELAVGLVAHALTQQGESAVIVVRVVEGPHAGKELALDRFDMPYVVGRMKSAHLPIEDEDLSRRHVELTRRAERVYVKDLGSKNGTLLGDQPLAPKQDTVWPKGVLLQLGEHRLAYEDPVRDAMEELDRVADERLPENETFEPPGSPNQSPEEVAERPASEIIAKPPATRRKRTSASRSIGWTATDVLVAFLALVVLALSVGGLIWLIGTGS